jgi:hypothetical protein
MEAATGEAEIGAGVGIIEATAGAAVAGAVAEVGVAEVVEVGAMITMDIIIMDVMEDIITTADTTEVIMVVIMADTTEKEQSKNQTAILKKNRKERYIPNRDSGGSM